MAKITQKSRDGNLISDNKIEELARRLLPEIQRFFRSEDGRREFEKWKAEQSENSGE